MHQYVQLCVFLISLIWAPNGSQDYHFKIFFLNKLHTFVIVFCSLYIIHTEQTLYTNQFIIKVQVLSSFSFLSFVVYYVCLSGIFTQRHTIAETSLRESTHCWSFVHNPHSVSLWSYSFLLY